MTRIVSTVLLALLALALLACSDSPAHNTSTNAPLIPNIAGSWEFRMTSSNGQLTGMEVALQEGQVLTSGVYQPDGNISASGTQMAFVTFDPGTGLADGFGGYCAAGDTSANNLSGAITALGSPVSDFTYTENGNVFNVTATLSADGQSMQGSYESATPSNCLQSGTFTGMIVPKLSGTYAGTLTLPSCSATGCDSATATLSENSSANATLSLILSGTDNSTLTLTGPVTGNAFSVQGTL